MRGEIQNRERARQLRDFSNLRWGNITPTDFDLCVEFHDRLFVFGEAKMVGAELPFGQKLALERVCDAIAETGRTAAALILEHDTEPEEDIDFSECTVRKYRLDKDWHDPRLPITCKAAIEALRRMVGLA